MIAVGQRTGVERIAPRVDLGCVVHTIAVGIGKGRIRPGAQLLPVAQSIPVGGSSRAGTEGTDRLGGNEGRERGPRMREPTLEALYRAVVNGQLESAREEIQAVLEAGLPPDRILKEGLIAAMEEVGSRFEAGVCFVPEMLVAARAMKDCLLRLRPLLVEADVRPVGRVVIGTVAGDLHDIGKNLVAMMLEGAGFDVFDLGVDVSPQRFVQAVREREPDIVALSALLTTTMAHMATTIEALGQAGLRDGAKVIVGGAPLTEAYAQKIGADGYAPDASRATTLAKALAVAAR